MGECALRIESLYPVDLVTMLDTPFPVPQHVLNLRSPGYLQRVISSNYGRFEDRSISSIPADMHYRKEDIVINYASAWDPGLSGHSWSYLWYTKGGRRDTPKGGVGTD